MPIVYSNPDPSITHLVRNALEAAGITAIVRGDRPGAAMGEIPPVAAWSEVVVGDRFEDAQALVVEMMSDTPAGEPWTCASCGESLESHFGMCWSCGTSRPD